MKTKPSYHDYWLTKKCIGVTFQPDMEIAGRLLNFNPATDRYTMTETALPF